MRQSGWIERRRPPSLNGDPHGTGDGLFSTEACAPSIVGAATFHFRVRDGNGWFHCALATGHDQYSRTRPSQKPFALLLPEKRIQRRDRLRLRERRRVGDAANGRQLAFRE